MGRKKPQILTFRPRAERTMVQVGFSSGGWELGTTVAHAMGELAWTHPELLGLHGDREHMEPHLSVTDPPERHRAAHMCKQMWIRLKLVGLSDEQRIAEMSELGRLVLDHPESFRIDAVHDHVPDQGSCEHSECVIAWIMEL